MGQARLLEVAEEPAGQQGQADQVSMSQRQQQQRAVQQAVRQEDVPRSSLLWSSTTYTRVERGERVRMNSTNFGPYRAHASQTRCISAYAVVDNGGRKGLSSSATSPPPPDTDSCRDKH